MLESDISLAATADTSYHQDFEVYQGEERNIRFRLMDGDEPVLVDQMNDIHWRVRRSFANPDVVISKGLMDGSVNIIPGTNIFYIPLRPVDTDGLEGYYWHDLRIFAGKIFVATVGRIDVKKSTF